MGWVSKVVTENSGSQATSFSTWTNQFYCPDVTASLADDEDELEKTIRINGFIIRASYSGSNKGWAKCYMYLRALPETVPLTSDYNAKGIVVGQLRGPDSSYNYVSWSSGESKDLPLTSNTDSRNTYKIADLFTSNNATSKTVKVYGRYVQIQEGTAKANFPSDPVNHNSSMWQDNPGFPGTSMGQIATITLDAPPSFDYTDVICNTSTPYAGKTTATVTLSNLHARYGGNITSATLTIGDQVSASRTTDGDLTIDLNAVGSFDPVVTVTDSRGQVRTIQLSTIYVYAYICNVSMATVERIDASTNKLKDEGTNALLKANFNYSAYTGSSLIAPVVKINDTVTNNVTWYTSWNNTSGFSGQVSDWSAILSGQTLYAKISDNFGINTSYTIDLYPQTTVQAASSESFVSLTLSQAFYLIAGKAGGHGLGIGKKPSKNDFEVAMVSTFEDKVYVLDELKVYDDATFREDIILDLVDYDLSGTTDYNIYEAICDLGWDSDVLIDDTIIHI